MYEALACSAQEQRALTPLKLDPSLLIPLATSSATDGSNSSMLSPLLMSVTNHGPPALRNIQQLIKLKSREINKLLYPGNLLRMSITPGPFQCWATRNSSAQIPTTLNGNKITHYIVYFLPFHRVLLFFFRSTLQDSRNLSKNAEKLGNLLLFMCMQFFNIHLIYSS
jgi:hypothetical protein